MDQVVEDLAVDGQAADLFTLGAEKLVLDNATATLLIFDRDDEAHVDFLAYRQPDPRVDLSILVDVEALNLITVVHMAEVGCLCAPCHHELRELIEVPVFQCFRRVVASLTLCALVDDAAGRVVRRLVGASGAEGALIY